MGTLSRPRSKGDMGELRPLLSVSHGEWVVKMLREGDEGSKKVLEHVSLASLVGREPGGADLASALTYKGNLPGI